MFQSVSTSINSWSWQYYKCDYDHFWSSSSLWINFYFQLQPELLGSTFAWRDCRSNSNIFYGCKSNFETTTILTCPPPSTSQTSILGYLIPNLRSPTDQARTAVAHEVNACSGDEESLAIGQLYFDHYIRACKHIFCLSFVVLKSFNSQNDPVPSSDSHISLFDTHKATIKAMLVEAPQNHKQAKANVSATDSSLLF